MTSDQQPGMAASEERVLASAFAHFDRLDRPCSVCGHPYGKHDSARKHCPKVDASPSHEWPWRDTVFVDEHIAWLRSQLLTNAAFRQGWDYATQHAIDMAERNAVSAARGQWTGEVERGRVGAYHSMASDLRAGTHLPVRAEVTPIHDDSSESARSGRNER